MTLEGYWKKRAADWPTAEQNAKGYPKRKISKQEQKKIDQAVKDVHEDELKQIAANRRKNAKK